MVQMKEELFCYLYRNFLYLYIPHGSDESGSTRIILVLGQTDFISHMVQMKAPPAELITSTTPTLYPTWFR